MTYPTVCNEINKFYPKEKWEEENPNLLEKFNAFDKSWMYILHDMNTTGLMVIRNGKIMFKYGDISELSYIASCRKSLLAMLYGNYVVNGTINLNQTLEEFGIDDVQGLMPIEKKATIKHLLTARSGVYHPASNGGDNSSEAPERGSQIPGEYFLYNNWDFNAAGTIFEKLTGKNIYEAFEQDIAIPIQMEDYSLDKQKKYENTQKSLHAAYHFTLSTRDMARLGYLMLQKGMWNEKQIIPKTWIDEILQVSTKRENMNPLSKRSGMFSYGYLWWIFDHNKCGKIYEGAFTAAGYFGQYITVLPELDIVIAHKTKATYLRNTFNYIKLLGMIVKNLNNFPSLESKEKRQIQQYIGAFKKENNDYKIVISSEDSSLFYESTIRKKIRLLPYKKDTYVTADDLFTMVKFIKYKSSVFNKISVVTGNVKGIYFRE